MVGTIFEFPVTSKKSTLRGANSFSRLAAEAAAAAAFSASVFSFLTAGVADLARLLLRARLDARASKEEGAAAAADTEASKPASFEPAGAPERGVALRPLLLTVALERNDDGAFSSLPLILYLFPRN